MFGEISPAARILQKEAVPLLLQAVMTKMDSLAIKPTEFESRAHEIITNELPHLAKAFKEPEPPKPKDLGGKLGIGAPAPVFDNRKQTGTSITQGNYLNLS